MRTIYRCSFLVGIVVLTVVGISGCRPTEIPATLAAASNPPAISTASPAQAIIETTTLTQMPSINETPASFPLGGGVQESFEQGGYVEGMEKAQTWVGIWVEMGIITPQSIGGAGNSLNPVPLDGRARVVCVDTKGQGEYAGSLLCPPLGLVNGGLKSIPESGNWDRNADGPLFITLDSSEELVTKGTGTDLAYQIINRYTGVALRYIDPKTGNYVDGEYQVPGGEIKLPEIVPERMNQIEELSFNMEFKDPQAAYRMLLETVVSDNFKNENF
jgi:hypothetical protein